MPFKGKVVWVTGGSSGIGLAIARQFAAQGAGVHLLARSQERLEEALASLQTGAHSAHSLDVSNEQQVAQVLGELEARVGAPDILVNSAGVAHPGYVQELDLEIYRWMMQVNYFGAVQVTKAVLPGLLARGSGHIVNIGSVASYIGVFGYTAYGSSKFALRGFSDALRAELKPHGIQVSIVYPPDTDTPQLAYENQYKPPELRDLLPELGVVSPEQVAEKVLEGIARGRYAIHTDFGSRLIYHLANFLGDGVYPIQDWLVKRARFKNNGRHGK